MGSVVCPRCNHAQQQVRAVILDIAAKNLLVSWDRRCTFDAAESMDGSPNAQVTHTSDSQIRAIIWHTCTLRAILYRYFGKPDADGANVASKHITTIQGFSSSDCVIQSLEVD